MPTSVRNDKQNRQRRNGAVSKWFEKIILRQPFFCEKWKGKQPKMQKTAHKNWGGHLTAQKVRCFLKATPHKCVIGFWRIFFARNAFVKPWNTQSIPAVLHLFLTKKSLVRLSRRFARYCLNWGIKPYPVQKRWFPNRPVCILWCSFKMLYAMLPSYHSALTLLFPRSENDGNL